MSILNRIKKERCVSLSAFFYRKGKGYKSLFQNYISILRVGVRTKLFSISRYSIDIAAVFMIG